MSQKQGNENVTNEKSPYIFIGGVASPNEIEDFYRHIELEDKNLITIHYQ